MVYRYGAVIGTVGSPNRCISSSSSISSSKNKQGLAFRAGNYDAVSLYLGYGTNLVGMKVWLWQASSSIWHSATKEAKDKFGIVGWTYGLIGGLQILGLRGWNLGAGR